MYRKLTKPQHKDMPTWCAELHPNWTMDVRTAGSNSYMTLNKVRLLLERELLPNRIKNIEKWTNFHFCTKVNYTAPIVTLSYIKCRPSTLAVTVMKPSCKALRPAQHFCRERLCRISWQSNAGSVARDKWRTDGRGSFQIRKQCLKTKIQTCGFDRGAQEGEWA